MPQKVRATLIMAKTWGELNGLGFYHQSAAIQGSTELLADIQAQSTARH
jgi:hypothetical protein